MLSYLQCLTFCVYVYLCAYVIYKNPRSRVNRLCALILASFALWAFGYIFAHNVHAPKNIAIGFMRVASVGWVMFAVLFLWFTIVFTRRKIAFARVLCVLSFVAATVFIYAEWSGLLVTDLVKVYYGWGKVWTGSVWFYAFCCYYIIAVLLSLIFMLDFHRKTTVSTEKKAVKTIFLSTFVPLIFGTLTDVILPKAGIRFIPNIADILVLFWASGLVVAIVKYKFLVFTPAVAAEDIISTMTDSLILISPSGKILLANKYTTELFGYKEDELIDKPFEDICSESVLEMIRGDLTEGISVYPGKVSYENVIKDRRITCAAKGGNKIPVSFTGSVMKDKVGNLLGMVGIMRDMRPVEKFIENEKALAKAAALKRTEHVKVEEMKKAYDDLKNAQTLLVQSEKLRALGQLGAGVAHELNSPLAGMLCLMRVYMSKKDPSSREYVDLSEMIQGCEYMARIIKDLSDFTKETKDSYDNININDTIKSSLVLITPGLHKRNINTEIIYADGLRPVRAERQQMQQVIFNLIINARDAIKNDGLIKIETRNVEVSGKAFVHMIITDNGCGMSEEVKQKIFNQFFTTKGDKEGVGLGLAIVNSIVTKYGGTIKVESEPGKRTTFTIAFPAEEIN